MSLVKVFGIVVAAFVLNVIYVRGVSIKDRIEQLINPQVDGVVTWSIGSFIKPENKSLDFELKIYSPAEPGMYPVIFFLTGFDGVAPAFGYNEFCSDLVLSSDSIIIAFDKFGVIHLPDKEELLFEATLNWTLDNLGGIFDSKKTPSSIRGKVFPDLKTSGGALMSHSSAGHVVTAYLNKTCGPMQKLILLDPVDGYDPFGYINSFITHPPQQLPFLIPTLISTTAISDEPLGKAPPCAPTNISNVRFYDSLPGPTWYLNVTKYGHGDLLDAWIAKVAGVICKPCQDDCQLDLYHKNAAKAISLFLKGVQEKNSTYLSIIENPTGNPAFDQGISFSGFFDHHGYDVTKTGPFCIHT